MRTKVRIAGSNLAYEMRGTGPAVLFLHAFPLSLSMWDSQMATLAEKHTVVRFDARGFGASPPVDGLLTMERVADDAVALLDHLEISRAVVCGCSMGGYAALALVRRHSDRLRGLVLADTRAEGDSPEARSARSLLADKVRRQGAEAAAEAFLPRLVGTTTHAERPRVVTFVRETMLATSAEGICNGLAGLAARADSRPTLKEIAVPTLMIVGEEDLLTPPSVAASLQHAVRGSRLEIIPRAGHLSNLENPQVFNAVLGRFLEEIA